MSVSDAVLSAALQKDIALWEYWGFAHWRSGEMSGVSRKVTFLKPALLGDVAKYYAIDTIVWNLGTDAERETLWQTIEPQEDVMTQRFLFLEDREKPLFRIKSFFWGLRGYREFHSYWPGGKFDARLKDLAPLVDRAFEINSGALAAQEG